MGDIFPLITPSLISLKFEAKSQPSDHTPAQQTLDRKNQTTGTAQ